jgi:hypothetical protein
LLTNTKVVIADEKRTGKDVAAAITVAPATSSGMRRDLHNSTSAGEKCFTPIRAVCHIDAMATSTVIIESSAKLAFLAVTQENGPSQRNEPNMKVRRERSSEGSPPDNEYWLPLDTLAGQENQTRLFFVELPCADFLKPPRFRRGRVVEWSTLVT